MNRSGWNINGSPRYSRPCSGLVRLPDSGRLIDFGGSVSISRGSFSVIYRILANRESSGGKRPLGIGPNDLLAWGPAEMPKLWGWLVD